MTISIEYKSILSANNNNIVIFVSNLSQLKNIDFPINFESYLNKKDFVDQFKLKNYVDIENTHRLFDKYINIKIFLIKTSSNFYNIGSEIYKNNFNYTFVFSSKLLKNNKSSIANLILGYCLKSYVFNKYKTINKKISNSKILYLFNLKKFKELNYNLNLLKSINFAKDLVSEPANILNPISFAKKCNELKKLGIKVNILNKKKLQEIGMRSLLAVSQGSFNDPCVVILEWNLKKKTKPTILAGKGVTFDTGGISLKPSLGMEEMITDMGGSAVVVGSMMNAALNNSSKSLVGIIGLVENMPDGKAQRPGDIVESLSGQTIEVLNTDAEGRMVLADILTFIQNKFKSKEIIDFATLTGAIMIALGTHKAGLFSNNNKLAKKLEDAGNFSGENLWRLPLGPEYDKEINSIRADIKNIGSSRYGGSIHAAQFIKRFVEDDTPWAHIDIAGVSWTMKSGLNSFSKLHSPGATAFGVRLIDQFLKGK